VIKLHRYPLHQLPHRSTLRQLLRRQRLHHQRFADRFLRSFQGTVAPFVSACSAIHYQIPSLLLSMRLDLV